MFFRSTLTQKHINKRCGVRYPAPTANSALLVKGHLPDGSSISVTLKTRVTDEASVTNKRDPLFPPLLLPPNSLVRSQLRHRFAVALLNKPDSRVPNLTLKLFPFLSIEIKKHIRAESEFPPSGSGNSIEILNLLFDKK